jgi:hypothetical protein
MAVNDDFRARLGDIYATWTGQIASCIEEAAAEGRVKRSIACEHCCLLVNSWKARSFERRLNTINLRWMIFLLSCFQVRLLELLMLRCHAFLFPSI